MISVKTRSVQARSFGWTLPEVRIVGGSVPEGLLAAANGKKFPGTRVTSEFPRDRQWSRAVKSKTTKVKRGTLVPLASVTELRPPGCLAPLDEHGYKRSGMIFTHGRGCYVFDQTGEKVSLDFLGGIAVNALGYSDPSYWCARFGVKRDGRSTCRTCSTIPFQGPLAAKLAAWSHMDRVFFINSWRRGHRGRSLKLARISGPAQGRSPAAHAYSGAGEFYFTAARSARFRSLIRRSTGSHSSRCVPGGRIRSLQRHRGSGVEVQRLEVCAIVIEPIQGEGGIFPVSDTFWTRARALATQHGAALIADEIQSGLGRTGRAFAYQRLTGLPDIVVVAKPLAGGLPLGAFLAREEFAAAFSPGLHGSTFGGGPLVCATALAFLDAVDLKHLLANVRARGAELLSGLKQLAAKFDFIREVRGQGLMVGVDLSVEGGWPMFPPRSNRACSLIVPMNTCFACCRPSS